MRTPDLIRSSRSVSWESGIINPRRISLKANALRWLVRLVNLCLPVCSRTKLFHSFHRKCVEVCCWTMKRILTFTVWRRSSSAEVTEPSTMALFILRTSVTAVEIAFRLGSSTSPHVALALQYSCHFLTSTKPIRIITSKSKEWSQTRISTSFSWHLNRWVDWTVDNSSRLKICLQQKTSFPLEIAARFQLNVLITPIPRFNLYANVPRKFMPILWFEQHVVASNNIANLVKLILAAPTAGQIIGALLVIIGSTLILTSCLCKRSHRYDVPSIDVTKTDAQQTTKLPETLPLMRKW